MEQLLIEKNDLCVYTDPETGITQIVLFGTPMLAGADSAEAEIAVNGHLLRVHAEDGAMRTEHWVNQYTGFGLEITRMLQVETAHRRLALAYHIGRHPAPATYPTRVLADRPPRRACSSIPSRCRAGSGSSGATIRACCTSRCTPAGRMASMVTSAITAVRSPIRLTLHCLSLTLMAWAKVM